MEQSVGMASCPEESDLEESIVLTSYLQEDSRSFKRNRPPFRKNEFKANCIVWTPFVPITAALPWIGHLGITDADGEVHEFMYGKGSHGTGLSFGPICRYYPLDQHRAAATLDKGIDAGYLKMANSYMLNWVCCNNCHSFVAWALDEIAYEGSTHWTMIEIAVRIFFLGRFASISMFLYWFIPSAIFFYLLPSTMIYLLLTPLIIFGVPNWIRRKLSDRGIHEQTPPSHTQDDCCESHTEDDCCETSSLRKDIESVAEAEADPTDGLMQSMEEIIGKATAP